MSKVSIYTDGGSRGNPGASASAFVALDSSDEVVYEEGKYLGVNTNNFAEYSAVLMAMQWIAKSDYEEVNFYIDSELVVKQLTGVYRIKNQVLSKLASEIIQIERSFEGTVKYTHVVREKNKGADLLVNQTLDSHGQID